tara:strand:+ start:122 stop:445 length:324 start_codon:yes stop_codon:yes gene_type:complete
MVVENDSDIEKLAEQIFEQEDDLPNELTTSTRIWMGTIEFNDGQHRPIVGFTEEDLRRRAMGRGRLIWTDYYVGGLVSMLSDGVEELWDYAFNRAEKIVKINKESEE